jgi:hypothetical protein
MVKIKKMKKKIELNPEWVIRKLSHTQYNDGEGNISVYTGNASDANWIELALDTLNIQFETHEYLSDNGLIYFGFEFTIEDIQVDCPILYNSIKALDNSNMNKKPNNI